MIFLPPFRLERSFRLKSGSEFSFARSSTPDNLMLFSTSNFCVSPPNSLETWAPVVRSCAVARILSEEINSKVTSILGTPAFAISIPSSLREPKTTFFDRLSEKPFAIVTSAKV